MTTKIKEIEKEIDLQLNVLCAYVSNSSLQEDELRKFFKYYFEFINKLDSWLSLYLYLLKA